MVTDEYARELDRGIVWNDPEIGVQWPIADPVLSRKDAHLPLLKDADNNFEIG
jgi:dTDP-4-dehydrorhamnose 3,5-epimerase